MNEENPIKIFQKEAPEVAKAFDGVVKALIDTNGLDGKTKQLMYIGIKCALEDKLAVKYHVPMAKKLGATREEIKDTILLTLSTSGLKSVLAFLPEALKAYDEAE